MLRVRVWDSRLRDETESHDFAGDCLASPREQALAWLHENGFAYAGTERQRSWLFERDVTVEKVWDEFESVRNPLFYATLEEL